MLVLPFVSLCNERTTHLESLLAPMARKVKKFYGGYGGGAPILAPDVGECVGGGGHLAHKGRGGHLGHKGQGGYLDRKGQGGHLGHEGQGGHLSHEGQGGHLVSGLKEGKRSLAQPHPALTFLPPYIAPPHPPCPSPPFASSLSHTSP